MKHHRYLKSPFYLGCIIFILSSGISVRAEIKPLTPALTVTRLNSNQPIITKKMFLDIDPKLEYDGKNINGPCMVRIPDWVRKEDRADPSAVYYLYFASHSDVYIRMAWAAEIEGPYTLYNTHADPKLDDGMPGRGVLDMIDKEGRISFPGSKYKAGRTVASPDVIIDDKNRQFIMYLHMGNTGSTGYDSSTFNTGGQKTMIATSATGLNFNQSKGHGNGGVGGGEPGHGLKPGYLGNAYFRVFEVAKGQPNAGLYAFTNYGPIWKAPNPDIPWDISHVKVGRKIPDAWQEQKEKQNNPICIDLREAKLAMLGPKKELSREEKKAKKKGKKKKGKGKNQDQAQQRPDHDFSRANASTPRHFAVLFQEDGKTLEVWYTARGDAPERIFRTTMDTSKGDWHSWDTVICSKKDVHQEMLRPEYPWEGADLPVKGSSNGQTSFSHAMRDPDLFRDHDGRIYLLYVGGGESAIGIASVELAQ